MTNSLITTTFKTPERQIVDPVYKEQLDKIRQTIQRNFRLKMQGGRI